MAEQLPAVFGNYILHELIARGGMAEIYRAKMRGGIDGFERQVAIKKILPHLAENEEFITMLIDEARISVSLNHANIAQVYDLGRVDDTYYIAMEYIPGVDLSHIIKRLAQQGYLLPLEHAIFITKELCAGLYFAHRKSDEHGNCLNIVHRDISPHNVLVSFSGDAKVIDFGVAKASVKLGQTRMGVIKGKLLYMAPEQAMAKPIDGRADIFSAGLCLYKMITGRLPFEASNEFQIYNKVLTAEVTPPREINPNIPEELDRIVMKSLERDLNRRYQDCWSMHQDLEQVLHRTSPGYTNSRLSRFLEQHFSEERAKLTKRLSSYPSLPASETSQPSMPAGQGPNTPAQGHLSNPGGREPVPVAANSYPNQNSYPNAGGGRPIPPNASAADAGQPITQKSAPIPALPTPESLGFRASHRESSGGGEGEADPTVDMQFDPSMLRGVEPDADRTQNMDLPADLVAQARAHLEQHKGKGKHQTTGRSKAPLIFALLGALLLIAALGFVGYVMFIDVPPEATPEVKPEEVVPEVEKEAEPIDPTEAIEGATHAVATGIANAADKTSAEVTFLIDSDPEGAAVTLGRDELGVTPLEVKARRADKTITYTLNLEGHRRATVELVPDRDRSKKALLEKVQARVPKAGGGAGGAGGAGGGNNGGSLMDPW